MKRNLDELESIKEDYSKHTEDREYLNHVYTEMSKENIGDLDEEFRQYEAEYNGEQGGKQMNSEEKHKVATLTSASSQNDKPKDTEFEAKMESLLN